MKQERIVYKHYNTGSGTYPTQKKTLIRNTEYTSIDLPEPGQTHAQ